MAIEQFGQSLLSQQRTRQQDIAKRQRRESRDVALGTLVGGIGDSYLKSKAENFLNNEANQAAKLNYKKHLLSAEKIIDDYTEAEKTDGGIRQYLINKRVNFLQLDAQKEWADKIDKYSASDLNKYYEQEATTWADSNVDNFKKAYNSAIEMGTLEDFQKAIAQGYEGPANMADLLVKGVTGFFKGKNPANAKASVASRRQDEMLQAGKSIESYNAAINQGWDINSAEKLQQAVDDKRLKLKDAETVSQREFFEDVSVGGKNYTVKRVEKVKKENDGSTVTTVSYDPDDAPTKKYLEYIAGLSSNEPKVTSNPPVTSVDEFGIQRSVTEIDVVDRFTGETTKLYNIQLNIGETSTEAGGLLTDTDRNIANQAVFNQTTERLYIDETEDDKTIQSVLDAYANQASAGDAEPTAEQINAIKAGVIDTIAASTRQATTMFGPTKEEDPDGSKTADLFKNYNTGISAITANAFMIRMGSKMNLEADLFVADSGYSLDLTNKSTTALELLASAASLDQSQSNRPVLPAAFVRNMINAVDKNDILDSEDYPYLKNVFNRITHGKNSEDTTETLNKFTEGLDSVSKSEFVTIFRTLEAKLVSSGRIDAEYFPAEKSLEEQAQQDLTPDAVPENVPAPPATSDIDLSMIENFEPVKRTGRGGSVAQLQRKKAQRLEEDPLYNEKLAIYNLVNSPFQYTGGLEKQRKENELRKAIADYNKALESYTSTITN